jgi:hypothetical protein
VIFAVRPVLLPAQSTALVGGTHWQEYEDIQVFPLLVYPVSHTQSHARFESHHVSSVPTASSGAVTGPSVHSLLLGVGGVELHSFTCTVHVW